MRSFTNLDKTIGRVPAPIVQGLSIIDVGKGSEALYRQQLPGLLKELANRTRIASITASSAIEGIIVPDSARADRILSDRPITLRTRSEQELAGYRDAQDYLFNKNWHPLNAGLLLHLHRLLFAHAASVGGIFKADDNVVVDRSPTGEISVRFKPVPAKDVDFFVTELITRYEQALSERNHHPVLLVGLFVLDLLVIHPFADGNGRVSRALTDALLIAEGYTVPRYVSLEQRIADSAESYYQTLLASTQGWHAGEADPWPWLSYFVELLAGAYRTFGERAQGARSSGSKQDRVRDYVTHHAPSVFRVSDIRIALPGISDQTIRLALDGLRREGLVTAESTGRGATWRLN